MAKVIGNRRRVKVILPDPTVVYDPTLAGLQDEDLNLTDIPAIEDFSNAMTLQEFLRMRRALHQE